jgi:hypothetical protein
MPIPQPRTISERYNSSPYQCGGELLYLFEVARALSSRSLASVSPALLGSDRLPNTPPLAFT